MTMTTDGDTNTARTLDRATRALEAYMEHGTWEKAAEVVGYSHRGTAYRAVMKLLGQRADASAAELRGQANVRHHEKVAFLENVIYDLDVPLTERLRAADAHTRAEARHARLNGLDAPVQVALSAGVIAELHDALAEADALVRGEVLESHDEPPED